MTRAGIVCSNTGIGANGGPEHFYARSPTAGANRHELFLQVGLNRPCLLAAEEIEIGDLVHAGNRAKRRTRFLGDVLAADVFHRIVFSGFAGNPRCWEQ